MEAYLHGVSTRKVDDLVKALGADTGISKSEVSRICADLDEEVGAFRDRSLAEHRVPLRVPRRDLLQGPGRTGRVVSQAVVIATGVTADGRREVLGFDVGDSEDGAFWTAFLRSLKARGLAGVQLVISDAHTGLKAAIAAVLHRRGLATLPGALHAQRARAWSPRATPEMVAAAIRTIFAQPDAEHVREQLDVIAAMLGKQLPKVEAMLRDAARRPARVHRLPGRALEEDLVAPTRSSGSTRRSNAAPTSSASSPTPQPCSAWPAPSWSRPTTNGRSRRTPLPLRRLHGPDRRYHHRLEQGGSHPRLIAS